MKSVLPPIYHHLHKKQLAPKLGRPTPLRMLHSFLFLDGQKSYHKQQNRQSIISRSLFVGNDKATISLLSNNINTMASSSSSSLPSLQLTMMPLSERSPDCISASTQEDMINGVTSQTSSRDMRRDQLRAMMIQEDREGYKCSDYLSYYTETSSVIETVGGDVGCTLRRPAIVVKNLNVSCRTSICEWMYRVVDHFGVDREGMFDCHSTLFSVVIIHLTNIMYTPHSRRNCTILYRPSTLYKLLCRQTHL